MKATKNDLLNELVRLKAENERLKRLVATQRPELQSLRDLEVALRGHIQQSARDFERMHDAARAMLGGQDDLPNLKELFGCMGEGAAEVERAYAALKDQQSANGRERV